jgi:hypothetical protein
MRKAFLLLLSSYAVLVALFATAASLLPIMRKRIFAGIAVGDVSLIIAIFLYGLFIYTVALLLIRVSCKDRR